jgi:hypothetical protein
MFIERRLEILAMISNSGYVLFYTLFLIYYSKKLFEQSWYTFSSVFSLLTLIFYIIIILALFFWSIFAFQKQQKMKFKEDLSPSISVQGYAKIIVLSTVITFFATIGNLIILIVERISESNLLFWITLFLAILVVISSFVVAMNVFYLILLERKRKLDLSNRIRNARKQGFSSIFEKEKASSLGFEDSEEWYKFLSSGYETKEEWESEQSKN